MSFQRWPGRLIPPGGPNPHSPVGGAIRLLVDQEFIALMDEFAWLIRLMQEDAFDTIALGRWADDGGAAPLDRESMI